MAKGKNFLKVTGILLIIFGAIAIIVSIIGLLGMSAATALMSGMDMSSLDAQTTSLVATGTTLAWVAMIFALVSAVAELIAGILGVKNCDKPEKVKICIIFGFIVLVFAILGIVLSIVAGGSVGVLSIVVSAICGIALPVLYLIGAFKNKAA